MLSTRFCLNWCGEGWWSSGYEYRQWQPRDLFGVNVLSKITWCWICKKNTKNTKWIKVKVVKKHSTWTSEGGNKLNCACGTNQLLYTMSHKKQYVEKYPHIIRNFLTYWFTDWAKNQSSIYYEILHRTLLSYTVVLKSSLNYSTIILRLLKEKTHLYMWNHPKCQSQS